MAAIWGAVQPLRILCTRELQNTIKESFHAELKNAINSCEWLSTQYDVGVDYLKHKSNGTEFIFKGLRHNIDGIKSMAQVNLVIVEEAETVPHASWQDLLPTIRAEGSEIIIVYNPKRRDSWVAQTFSDDKLPPRTIIADVNFDDNPWFPPVLEEQRLHDKATMPENLYHHIWEGGYLVDDERAIIKRSHIEAAIDAHLTLPELNWTGRKTVGYDPADQGDPNALAFAYGSIVEHIEEWKAAEDQLLESTMRVLATAKRLGADQIGYDGIGVGVGVGSILNDKKYRNHYKFMAGGKVANPDKHYEGSHRVLNKDFFANLKAQAWWILADRFRNTYNAVRHGHTFEPSQMISISSSIPDRLKIKLIDELATPLRDEDNTGKVKVESKKDLAKRGIESHNLADALVIAVSRDMLARRSLLDVL